MPKDYRIRRSRAGLLPWSYVEKRMAGAHNYWIGSSGADGRPHAMPVWGVWIERKFFFGTDRKSRKGRNLAANRAVVVHLESGDEVAILEGMAAEVKDRAKLAAIDDAFHAKYGMRLSTHPADVLVLEVAPEKVLGWREKDFNVSATRWRLG